MDGTLVDTEPYWIEAEFALVEEHGGAWSREQALKLVGNDLLVSGQVICEQTGIDLTPQQVVEGLLSRVVSRVVESVPWRPGALDLLLELRRRAVPCALVTASWTRLVDPVLRALPEATFEAVVTGDSVERGKPHPEPYLRAASILGLDASRCVAIEDSSTGARSARAAGCVVLVVPNHVPVETGPEVHLADSLAGLGADRLLGLT